MVKLSIIIVNYNVQYFLEQCLLSVIEASKNIQTEIIVVDNNSTDGSCSMILEKFPQVTLIRNSENLGFSKSNNQGVERANGEYILILNPDTVLGENIFEKILIYSESKEDFGALGVRFIDGTGNFLPECKRNFPSVRIAFRKLLGFANRYYANHIDEYENKEVDILSGAFMLLKRDVYLKNGGFDEDYFMYGEDVDLSYTLSSRGYSNYYFGEATIIHYKGESTIKDKPYLKNFYGAMQIFYKKHFKINNLVHFSLNVLFKLVMIYKLLKKSDSITKSLMRNKMIYIGDDFHTYDNIKRHLQTEISEFCSTPPATIENYELIILDSACLSFSEIIKYFEELKSIKIRKRIIPKNTNFIIGSDSSGDRGEVVQIDKNH